MRKNSYQWWYWWFVFSLFCSFLIWFWVCQFCSCFQRSSFCFVHLLYCFSPSFISALVFIYCLLLLLSFLNSLMISPLTHDYLEMCLILDIWGFLKHCYSFLILILLWFENTLWDLVLGNNSVLWLSILFILVIMYHTFAKKVYTTVYMYKVVCTSVRLRWWIVLFRYSVSLMFLSSLSTRWWKMHAEISLWLWYCSCLPLFLLSFDLYIFSFYY